MKKKGISFMWGTIAAAVITAVILVVMIGIGLNPFEAAQKVLSPKCEDVGYCVTDANDCALFENPQDGKACDDRYWRDAASKIYTDKETVYSGLGYDITSEEVRQSLCPRATKRCVCCVST